MEIGDKLKDARSHVQMTQEDVAYKIHVSRQTISNWENNRSYPDIISIIMLSNLYQISLDDLLKGDKKMIAHLDESTNIVNSNKKLIIASILNIIMFIVFIFFNQLISNHSGLLAFVLCFAVINISILFYQIIKKF